MSLAQTIIGKEKLLLDSQTRRSTYALRNLLSIDFIEIGSSGICKNFDNTLESLQSEQSWYCRAQDWQFRKLDDNIAQIMYQAFILHSNDETGVFSRRTSIWRMEENTWKMVFHQGTKGAPFDLCT